LGDWVAGAGSFGSSGQKLVFWPARSDPLIGKSMSLLTTFAKDGTFHGEGLVADAILADLVVEAR